MAIVGVYVRWGDYDAACIAVPDARLGVKFKCGKCSRGVVQPFMGGKCLLCGAVVSIVDDRARPKLFDRESAKDHEADAIDLLTGDARLMDEQDYETNAYTIRNAADKKAKARHAKTRKAVRTEKQKKLARWMKQNGYTNGDLMAKLSLDKWDRTTPEERTAISRRTTAIGRIKRKYCQHMKLAPKLRAAGKHAGVLCCPSCCEPVSAEVIRAWNERLRGSEDLVL